ncbi:hypothetical protein ID866_6453 [Astraeus odoratus]|nr:hypothetical protein ID866_6453 [Astraeus odoratus]
MDPERVREQFQHIDPFWILVIGRANYSKMTILQWVCSTADLPEVFNGKENKVRLIGSYTDRGMGHHYIRNEFMFQSNKGFIFHHSCGLKAGSEDEFDKMKKFMLECASTHMVDKQTMQFGKAIYYYYVSNLSLYPCRL